jgi:hypothetical protein
VAVLEEKSWTVKWEAAGAITAPLELVSYSLLMQEDVDGKC